MPSRKVFNELTYSDTIGILSVSAFRSQPKHGGFTYNDSPYINALNKALQLEHAAVAIYAAKQRRLSPPGDRAGASAVDRTDVHNRALRQLVQLIFAQRGIPAGEPAGITAVTGAVAARVSRYMPTLVQDPMLGVSAQRIEYALARRYRQILEVAPEADREIIRELLEQVSKFSQQAV